MRSLAANLRLQRTLGLLGRAGALGLALANWVCDAICLTACLLALRVRVPWPDLLFVYSLAQVAASLPITPGGLAVTEVSLTLMLTVYGVPGAGALAGTLLYRIIGFWVLVIIGWIAWLGFEVGIRGGLRGGPHPWAAHTQRPEKDRDTVRLPDRVADPPAGDGHGSTTNGPQARPRPQRTTLNDSCCWNSPCTRKRRNRLLGMRVREFPNGSVASPAASPSPARVGQYEEAAPGCPAMLSSRIRTGSAR